MRKKMDISGFWYFLKFYISRTEIRLSIPMENM